jgi:hypothetical protein
MSTLLVASSEPRVGRSLIAAAIAYRLGRSGTSVTLARLDGDDSARDDAATFAALGGIVAPDAPLTVDQVRSIAGDIVVEAPPGAIAPLAASLDARVVVVALPGSASLDAPPERLAGSIRTRVASADAAVVGKRAGVIAVLPEDRVLAAPSVADIAGALAATPLSRADGANSIDRVMIGTIASDAATPYFAQRERTCVITRFDKTDIQLAALQTDLECLVITGGGEPSPYLLDRIRNGREDVTVLLTPASTVDAVRALEPLFAASRFSGEGKLARAVELLDAAGVPAEL